MLNETASKEEILFGENTKFYDFDVDQELIDKFNLDLLQESDSSALRFMDFYFG